MRRRASDDLGIDAGGAGDAAHARRVSGPAATAWRWAAAVCAIVGAATGCTWNEVRVPGVEPGKPTAPAAAALDLDAYPLTRLDGREQRLSAYAGRTLLIVNTASECGLTPQYQGLQQLHERYAARGLSVLGFPCDDFGGQEPGTATEIQHFCSREFAVTFPLFSKLHAKGPAIAPLYRALTTSTGPALEGEIKWNFTKFLVAPGGKLVARFEPRVEPTDPRLIELLEANLPASPPPAPVEPTAVPGGGAGDGKVNL